MWCWLAPQLTTGVTTINVLRQSTSYKGTVAVRALGGSGLSAYMHFKDATITASMKPGAKLAASMPCPVITALFTLHCAHSTSHCLSLDAGVQDG